ncbi:MAG: hypothetical protein ACYDAG_10640 [Chloroflexota bacterium]
MLPDLTPQRGRFVFPAHTNSAFVPFPRPFPFTPSFVDLSSPVRNVFACNLTSIGFVCSLQPDTLIDRDFPVDWEAVI